MIHRLNLSMFTILHVIQSRCFFYSDLFFFLFTHIVHECRFDVDFQGSTDQVAYFTNIYMYGYESSKLPSKKNKYNYVLSLTLTIICSVIFAIIGIMTIIKLIKNDKATPKRLFVACLTTFDIVTDILLSVEYIAGFGCDYCIYEYQIEGIILLLSSIFGYIAYFIGLKIQFNNPDFDYTSNENKSITNPLWITTALQLIFEDVVAIVIVLMVSQDLQFMDLLAQMAFIQSMITTWGLLYFHMAVEGCVGCILVLACGPVVIVLIVLWIILPYGTSCSGSCTEIAGFDIII